MGNMQQAVQAVQQYAGSKAGLALGTVPASVVVRAAVATGKVPGYNASWANLPRHAGNGGAAMHALGRAYRQVPRSVGMGARANGFGTYGQQAAAAKVPTGKLGQQAAAKQRAASKQQAAAAKQQAAAAKAAPAK